MACWPRSSCSRTAPPGQQRLRGSGALFNILAFFANKLQSVGKNSGINYFNSAIINFSDKILAVYDRDPHIIGIFFNPR